jgi:hypothetical protein
VSSAAQLVDDLHVVMRRETAAIKTLATGPGW